MFFSRILVKSAICLMLTLGLFITNNNTQAQDCGCGSETAKVSSGCGGHTGGCGGCGHGEGLIPRIQRHLECDPSLLEGLWDNYANERRACQDQPFRWLDKVAEHRTLGSGIGGCNHGCQNTEVTQEQAQRFALLRPRGLSISRASSCNTNSNCSSESSTCDSGCRRSGLLANFGNLCRGNSRASTCNQSKSGNGCYKGCGHLFNTCSGSMLKRFSLFNTSRGCGHQDSSPCNSGCDSAVHQPIAR